MNIKTFLLNCHLAYQVKLLEDPAADRTKFFAVYSYGKLPQLDKMSGELASKVIGGSGRKMQMPRNNRLVTMAEYLMDSWFQIIFPNLPLPYGAITIPEGELVQTRKLLEGIRPMGAL